MDRIPTKTNPKLFDKAVLPIQTALANAFAWLDHSIGICEMLTSVEGGKRFNYAALYLGDEQYERVEPCEELGNFSFFYLRDPQTLGYSDKTLVKSPFSLVIWYDITSVSLPLDERNREAIKGRILALLESLHLSGFEIERIYENPKNVFSEFSYDYLQNQFLMQPFTGLRIDGTIMARTECVTGA